MRTLAMVKTVLIVDEDLWFVFWLGRLLKDAGYDVWPARSGADAAILMKELGAGLDLLVINPNSCGAAAFFEDQRRQTGFKTIAIQAQDEESAVIDGVDAALVKPQRPDEVSKLEWISVIESVLTQWEQ